MSYDLNHHTALVTGGAKRIGKAIALALASAGADIVVHYNGSEQDAMNTCREVESLGHHAYPLQGSLQNPNDMKDLFAAARALAGNINILINSAASFPSATITNAQLEDFHSVFDLNTLSPLFLSKELVSQGSKGVIINLLDTRISDYDREHAPYHIAKRSLADLTRMMAAEFAPLVRVNGIAPGLILPPEGKDDAYLRSLSGSNPLQTIGNPGQISDTALFLLTNEFITGQIIYVDGGRHLKGNFYGY